MHCVAMEQLEDKSLSYESLIENSKKDSPIPTLQTLAIKAFCKNQNINISQIAPRIAPELAVAFGIQTIELYDEQQAITEGKKCLEYGAYKVDPEFLLQALTGLKKRSVIYNGNLDQIIPYVHYIPELQKLNMKGIIPRKTAWLWSGNFKSPYHNSFNIHDNINHAKYIIRYAMNRQNKSEADRSCLQIIFLKNGIQKDECVFMPPASSLLAFSLIGRKLCYCRRTEEKRHELYSRSIDNLAQEDYLATICAERPWLIRLNKKGNIVFLLACKERTLIGYAYSFGKQALYLLDGVNECFGPACTKKSSLFKVRNIFYFKDDLMIMDHNMPNYAWYIDNAIDYKAYNHQTINTINQSILEFKKQLFMEDLNKLKQLEAKDVTPDTVQLIETLKEASFLYLFDFPERYTLRHKLNKEIKRLNIHLSGR